MKANGVNAVLINRSGNVRKAPIPKTDSEFFVLNPIAREIPDQARPKNAIVASIKRRPPIPVTAEVPSRYANPSIINDWIVTLNASLVNLPSNIADRLTGVTSIL